jgi:hypothetical protein
MDAALRLRPSDRIIPSDVVANPRPAWVCRVTAVGVLLLLLGSVAWADEVSAITQAEPKTKRADAAAISPRTKVILAKLDALIAMEFSNETPLEDVLKSIKQATKGPNDSGIPIYIDPLGLQKAERSVNSPITINVKGLSIKDILMQIRAQLGLAYTVKDDVLIISDPSGIEREQKESVVLAGDTSPKTKVVLAKLEEPLAMPFANETPLDDVLKYIRQATKKLANDWEMKIHVAPNGLQEVEQSLNSTVIMDLEGVPLKTTLRLLLKQLGLAYIVKDGLLIISSPEGVRKLKPKAGKG